MVNTELLKKLSVLYAEALRYEHCINSDEKIAEYDREILSARERGDTEKFLNAIKEKEDYINGFATYGVAKLPKADGAIDKKFVNTQDLCELLYYVGEGKAQTMEEALNLYKKNHNQK